MFLVPIKSNVRIGWLTWKTEEGKLIDIFRKNN